MKKSFTLLLAALLLAATNAFSLEVKMQKMDDSFKLVQNSPAVKGKLHAPIDLKRGEHSSVAANFQKNDFAREVENRIISMRKVRNADAQDDNSIEGDWIFTLGSYYLGDFNEPVMQYESQYTATLYDNPNTGGKDVVFWVDEPVRYECPMIARYDVENNILVFQKQIVATKMYFIYQVYVTQEPFILNENDDTVFVEGIAATYHPETGIINFNVDNGIAWFSYGDEALTDEIGLEYIVDVELAIRGNIMEEDASNWEDAGTAVLRDGWLLPQLGFKQNDNNNLYEVPLEQHLMNPNRYRLVDPYHIGPAAAFNESKTVGYIEFDVTDPDHVLVNPRQLNAGFANSELRLVRFYCYNYLQYLVNSTGYSASSVINAVKNTIPYTTYKDNVVTLSYYNDQGTIIYDANFGNENDRFGGYVWSDDNSVPMVSVIYMPGSDPLGIGSITDDSNISAPVYYDLNGVRVDNPIGGIYIKKEGAKVSKVIIK